MDDDDDIQWEVALRGLEQADPSSALLAIRTWVQSLPDGVQQGVVEGLAALAAELQPEEPGRW